MSNPAMRFARVHAALLLVALVFALLALVRAATPVGDQDAFWIAAAGRDVWATGHAPVENAYSFTDPLHAWVCHELAFAVVYAKGLAWLGPAFFDLAGVLAGATTVGLLAFHVARSTRHRLTLALVGLPVLLEVPLFHPRPPFASLGLVAAMVALAFGPRFTARHVALAVALEWVWTLSHGSFPLGIVLLLAAAAERPGPLRESERVRLVVAAALASAVTLLNPYGLRLHGLVGRYLVGDHEAASMIHGHIVEFLPIWRAPFAFGQFDAPAVALVVVGSLACVLRRRAIVRALLVLAFGVFAAFEVRNVHLALLLGAMLLAPEVDRLLPEPPDASTTSAPRTAVLAVLPGVLVATLLWLGLDAARPAAAWLGPNVGGPDLLAILPRIPDGAHVYAPFGISPAVIWYGAPRGLRVFYDSRNDCYRPDIAIASMTLEDPGSTPAATLASYGVEVALVRRGGPVAESLVASEAWSPGEERGALVLFGRRR